MRVAQDRFTGSFGRDCPAVIALEASGHYDGLVDVNGSVGPLAQAVQSTGAKRRIGLTAKTNKLDAKGLSHFGSQWHGSEVWIPPNELRDQRELLRLRIFLVHLRTRGKNRIHGTLARHSMQIPGADLFRCRGGSFEARRRGCRNCQWTVVRPSSKNWPLWTYWRCKSNPQRSGWKRSWR
jgi:transposase